jgi:hypothetical protein
LIKQGSIGFWHNSTNDYSSGGVQECYRKGASY